MKNGHKIRKIAILATMAAPLAFIGCGSGSGSGGGGEGNGTTPGTPTAQISSGGTLTSMEWVVENIPGCALVNGTLAPLTSRAQTNEGETLGLITRLYGYLPFGQQESGAPLLSTQPSNVVQGECGGTLSYEQTHQSGVTDYAITFDQFCYTDYSKDVPTATVIDGEMEAKEIGTPTDQGPLISSAEARATSLSISSGEEQMLLSFNAQMAFGQPDHWEPGVPTQGKPDVITLSASANFPNQEKNHSISGLRVEVYETPEFETVVAVTSGNYILTNGNILGLSTSSPLVFDDWGDLTAGTLDLRGADGGLVQVSPSGSENELKVRVNGEELSQNLVCDSPLSFY